MTVKNYFFYRIEERVSENNSDYFWRLPEVFTLPHPVNAWNGGSASAAFLVNTVAISEAEKSRRLTLVPRYMIGKLTWLHGREAAWVVRKESGLNENVLDTNNIET